MFVSGILALILEAEPALKSSPSLDCITQVKAALMESADPLESDIEHDSHWGYGSINGEDWLEQIRTSGIC